MPTTSVGQVFGDPSTAESWLPRALRQHHAAPTSGPKSTLANSTQSVEMEENLDGGALLCFQASEMPNQAQPGLLAAAASPILNSTSGQQPPVVASPEYGTTASQLPDSPPYYTFHSAGPSHAFHSAGSSDFPRGLSHEAVPVLANDWPKRTGMAIPRSKTADSMWSIDEALNETSPNEHGHIRQASSQSGTLGLRPCMHPHFALVMVCR